jgi:hypothetical protein
MVRPCGWARGVKMLWKVSIANLGLVEGGGGSHGVYE